MSRFRISKANALGDLFLYDNIGQTRLVLSQDANELRQLLNEHFGVTECAPCKAIHHLHTEPPLDPCFMCGGLPCRCDEPARRLHVPSNVPTGTGFLTRCTVCHEAYDSPEDGCPGEPQPAQATDKERVRSAYKYWVQKLDDPDGPVLNTELLIILPAVKAWLRIQEAAEQEERDRQKFYDDMRAFGEVRRARRERIAELAAKVADELIRALEEED